MTQYTDYDEYRDTKECKTTFCYGVIGTNMTAHICLMTKLNKPFLSILNRTIGKTKKHSQLYDIYHVTMARLFWYGRR